MVNSLVFYFTVRFVTIGWLTAVPELVDNFVNPPSSKTRFLTSTVEPQQLTWPYLQVYYAHNLAPIGNSKRSTWSLNHISGFPPSSWSTRHCFKNFLAETLLGICITWPTQRSRIENFSLKVSHSTSKRYFILKQFFFLRVCFTIFYLSKMSDLAFIIFALPYYASII